MHFLMTVSPSSLWNQGYIVCTYSVILHLKGLYEDKHFFHVSLQVGSDESDVEDEELQKRGSNIITASMIKKWEEGLQGPK